MKSDLKIKVEVDKRNEAGFTLIELLIVIVVLGILMSMAVPALSGVKNKADLAVAKADLHNIMHSLEMYYLDHGQYPTLAAEEDLSILEELNIKNAAADYSYQTDTAQEKYLVYYTDSSGTDDKYYYVTTDEASLIGPETTDPSTAFPG